MDDRRSRQKLDLAARAAWLYYIGGNTQEEIAKKLHVSRQAAQRLVSLAVSEKLIKFHLDHPIGECEALADALRQRYGLRLCEVAPADPTSNDPVPGIAERVAGYLQNLLAQRAPLVLAFATGRTLRQSVDQVPHMSCPQHKIVSLVGNMRRDGRASRYDVVTRLADRIGAECFPMPMPVIADSAQEHKLLQSQKSYRNVSDLAEIANVAFVGIGEVAWGGPLHRDGFVSDEELAELLNLGAVGDSSAWVFDQDGKIISGNVADRLIGIPLDSPPRRLTVGVAGGVVKAAAIRAALVGGLINGLMTDERTAVCLLDETT
ncbi:MAG: sugar-binding transcriptional regulator [Alphaproteobacteria bacterium]